MHFEPCGKTLRRNCISFIRNNGKVVSEKYNILERIRNANVRKVVVAAFLQCFASKVEYVFSE